MLLKIAAEANNTVETTNSPEINPVIPIIKIMPSKISLCKEVIYGLSWVKVKNTIRVKYRRYYEFTIAVAVDLLFLNY